MHYIFMSVLSTMRWIQTCQKMLRMNASVVLQTCRECYLELVFWNTASSLSSNTDGVLNYEVICTVILQHLHDITFITNFAPFGLGNHVDHSNHKGKA